MGIIFSRFRKKKTTLELLQKLEDKIKEIEEYGSSTEQRYKRIVGQLLIYSLGLYILLGIYCYFSFPTSLRSKILYFTFLILSPILLYLVKRIISWYYTRKINTNQSKLSEMKQEKKRLLEEVMDKETYKVAKEILEKFAPETLPRKVQPMLVPRLSIANTPQTLQSENGLRRRSTFNPETEPSKTNQPPQNVMATPKTSLPYPTPVPGSQIVRSNKPTPGMPLPAPILPRERNYLDRVVEYLIGDGPANRYALICSQCHSHNGMALKEEFEYIGFRCCYCFTFNPARKQRPEAPKLPTKVINFAEPESDVDTKSLSSEESNEPEPESSEIGDKNNETMKERHDEESNESKLDLNSRDSTIDILSSTASDILSSPVNSNDDNAFSSPCSETSVFSQNSDELEVATAKPLNTLIRNVSRAEDAELNNGDNSDDKKIDLIETEVSSSNTDISENKQLIDDSDLADDDKLS